MYQELQKGWIEIITGPMFAGKSEELIRRIRTLSYAHKKIVCFKPAIDDRYDTVAIASHDGEKLDAIPISSADEILEHVLPDSEVVGIDEIQFFSNEIISICEQLADRGVRVIAAGLDTDFKGEPFGPVPELLARAEFVSKLSAACTICGCAATRTQRLIDGKPAKYDDPVILVGAKESYQARCRKHHEIPGKTEKK